MKKKKLVAFFAMACMVVSLVAGCSLKSTDSTDNSDKGSTEEKQKITVGCLARDEEIVKWIADQLSDKYDISATVYSETVSIMVAAADGEDDLNYIANIPYLNSYNEKNNTELVFYKDQITNSPVYVVSQKYKSVDELQDGDKVAVANDSSNEKRELNILVDQGLIEIDQSVDTPTVLDVTSNSKNLELMEIDARSRVGALPDVAACTMPAMTYSLMDKAVIDQTNVIAKESNQACLDQAGQGFCCLSKNEDSDYMKDIWEVCNTKEFSDWLTKTYGDARIATGYMLQSGEIKYENPVFEVPDIY